MAMEEEMKRAEELIKARKEQSTAAPASVRQSVSLCTPLFSVHLHLVCVPVRSALFVQRPGSLL